MSDNGARAGDNGKLAVVLCHDFPIVRSGLKAIIDAESDMIVVGEAGNQEEARHLVEELKPQVIMTDFWIDGSNGLDAIRLIKNVAPWVKILVLAYQRCEEFFLLAMKAGADGYLTRQAEPTEVVNAIRCIARGQNYVNPSIVTLLVSTYVCRTRRATLGEHYELLSEREREILCLVATGHPNSEIAEILHLSKQTVHNLRARLMEKLGFHDRLELLRYAIRSGIISPEDI